MTRVNPLSYQPPGRLPPPQPPISPDDYFQVIRFVGGLERDSWTTCCLCGSAKAQTVSIGAAVLPL